MNVWKVLASAILIFCGSLMQGCGGSTPDTQYVPGVYESQFLFEDFCAVPRVGIDPATSANFPDKQGSAFLEKMWLRSWINDYYLWYDEVPDIDPAGYTTNAYFQLLKTNATTTTGRPKDRFHFSYPSAEWFALSQGGLVVSYGISFSFKSNVPPRQLLVAYVDPNSPATTLSAAIPRGASVVAIDGIDLVNSTSPTAVAALNAGLFPASVGESHQFSFIFPGEVSPRTITLTAQVINFSPVTRVSTVAVNNGVIGYIHFTDHYATAEYFLYDAFNTLVSAGATDLVLDLRYNGGGFLDIASEVAFMIAGPLRTAGKIFERQNFNPKHTNVNPITGQTISPMPFHSQSRGFSQALPAGRPLPNLNLNRVFILSTKGTCSASESIINGLRGIDVEVVLIGGTTCGKPFAFYPQDNCGTTYFSIQMEGVNHKGFGDYPDGFSPANASVVTSAPVAGCAVADDFTYELGDPREGLFAAALQYRSNQTCPAPSTMVTAPSDSIEPGILLKPEPMMNRILRGNNNI